jgi:hypothetical protein
MKNIFKNTKKLFKIHNFSHTFKTQSKIPKEDESLENLLEKMTTPTKENFLMKQIQKGNLLVNGRKFVVP